MDTSKVTRVEVITKEGREYVSWHNDHTVELVLQDDDRTLKIFIRDRK